jgi:hypothetical protein
VAGLGIRLFTDEMISPEVAAQLQRRGYDALSCQATNRLGYSDEDQLTYATSERRAIVSFNARDFIPLDARWKVAGTAHAGIILTSADADIGRLVLRLARHLDIATPAMQADTLLWLGTVP